MLGGAMSMVSVELQLGKKCQNTMRHKLSISTSTTNQILNLFLLAASIQASLMISADYLFVVEMTGAN